MEVIKYLWQLPQHLLGLLLIKLFKCKQSTCYWITQSRLMTGISLGEYIIVRQNLVRDIVLQHERGHQKQSLYLGWMYLVVIGLPSILGNIAHRFIKFNYYAQPWERWADKLGGVAR